MMTKTEMTEAIILAKAKKKLTWNQIAGAVGLSEVFTTSACLGQNSLPSEYAAKLVSFLDLNSDVEAALQAFPLKGNGQEVPSDPLIYRFFEISYVYGTTLKEIIHEKFGDGIMSAIDFSMDVEKLEDPKGDRVKVIMNGKFLPYKKW
ncbi:cyanase [Cytophagaceae bacterium ABcell3]|nr:cyanase [Cytophagaceae bacterium ABcell3]